MASISLVASAASISASTTSQLMTNVAFSTTIDRKSYSADVTYSNGEYVASDSNLAGADATGASLQSAENNLTI
jgi:hypothetical protein